MTAQTSGLGEGEHAPKEGWVVHGPGPSFEGEPAIEAFLPADEETAALLGG